MKRIVKKSFSFLIIVVITLYSVVSYSAVTYYQYDGYKYKDYGINQISLSGWDDSSDTLVLPDNIVDVFFVSIDDYALRDDTVIKTVDLSRAKHLKKIGTGAFSGCSSLESVSIPEWTTELSDYLFQNCTGLKNVSIEAPVTKINTQMFNRCSSLESFTVPDSVLSIEKYAFGNCTSLSTIVIPKSVENISSTAFANTNATFLVYFGTYAHQYAMDNNIAYVLLDGVKLGDADGDGAVTINDVTAIQQHVADMKYLEGIYLYAADVNRDGVTNISDATDLQRFLAEYEVEYPIDSVITQ